MLTITHTHADGTTLDGSRKHDGVLEIVRRHAFTWRRAPGIHIPNSRDKDARRADITAAADALRAAGHEVTVEIDDTPRATAEREADRAERADARADRYAERADKADTRAEQHRAAGYAISDRMTDEPVKVGHHSESRHRRDFERVDSHRRREFAEADYARELSRRADAVGHNLEHRGDPRVIMRRVERLEADAGHWARVLADDTTPADYRQRAEREAARLAEEIGHWRGELGKMRAADVFVPWGPEHFQVGDMVSVGGMWCKVRRVNKKSVSVPWIVGTMSNGQESDHSDTVKWDKVTGRRRDGMQLDRPNGEPWPLDLAVKVSRWASLCRSVGKGGYDDAARRQDTNVRWAQRVAHGLDLGAADSEVAAHQPDADDIDARRMLAAAYLNVFGRLTAGERVAAILADLPDMPQVEPEWQMPEGDPQRVPVRDVKPGDIVQGVYDAGLAGGGGEMLLRGFAGPVESVTPHEGDDHSGERFIGWWYVTLTTGERGQYKPWQALAVHPAEPDAEATDTTDAEPTPAPPAVVPPDVGVAAAKRSEVVQVVDLQPGMYARIVGGCLTGKALTAAGYVQSAKTTRITTGRKSRDMVTVEVAEQADSADGWRKTIYVEPTATAMLRELSPPVRVNGIDHPAGWLDAVELDVVKDRSGWAVRSTRSDDRSGIYEVRKTKREADQFIADAAATRRRMYEHEQRPAPAAPVNPWDDLLAAHLHTSRAA